LLISASRPRHFRRLIFAQLLPHPFAVKSSQSSYQNISRTEIHTGNAGLLRALQAAALTRPAVLQGSADTSAHDVSQ